MAKVFGGQLNAISRGLRLHRAGMKVLRGGSSLPEWTHIYEGLTTFGELYSAWQPSGNDHIEKVVFYWDGSVSVVIVDSDAGNTILQIGSSGNIAYFNMSEVTLNGVPINSGEAPPAIGLNEVAFKIALNDVKYIGATNTGSDFFSDQIHRIQLLDNDDPSNSIDINTVKRSKDAPSASDNLLVNSLGSVGEELVVNGDFEDGGAGWDLNGWMVDGTTVTNFATTNSACSQVALEPLVVGGTYEVTFSLLARTGGFVYPWVGGKIQDIGQRSSIVGVHTFYVTIQSLSDNTVGVLAGNTPNGIIIDSISVRKTNAVGSITNLTGYELVNRGE